MPAPDRSHRLALARDLATGLLLVVAAVANAHRLADYVFEDAFITYRYALNLGSGLGFVFNPGEAVLGTSAPWLTLWLAFWSWLGVDVVTAGGATYCVSLSAAGALGWVFLRRHGYPNAGVVFALATVWAIGDAFAYFGLETTLHLALILAAIVAADADRPTATGTLLGLVCLNRYDGMVVAFVVGLFLWARRGRPPWREAAIASTMFGAWLVFAAVTFGALTPNTLGAKAGDTPVVEYIAWTIARQSEKIFKPLAELGLPLGASAMTAGWLLIFTPCLFFGYRLLRRHPAFFMPLGSAALLVIGYAVIGPPMRHQWYHLPGLYAVLLVALGAWAVGTDWLLDSQPQNRLRALPWAMAMTAVVVTAVVFPTLLKTRSQALLDGPVMLKIGAYKTFIEYIDEHDLGDTSLLTYEPGFTTYHTGQRAIDAAGLITPGIFYHGPKDRASSWHDLLTEHQPDLFVLQMLTAAADPRQLEHHVPVATDAGHFWLFMSHRLLDQRFEALYQDWQDGASATAPRSEAERVADVQGGWEVRGNPMNSVAGMGFVLTEPFLIDFDELVLEFQAASHKTLLQLMVDGVVVLTFDGDDSNPSLRRRAIPVYPWRGRQGRLRLIDRDQQGAIQASLPIPWSYPATRMIDDFEAPTMSSLWRQTWSDAPAPSAALARRFGVHFAQGHGVASSLGLDGEQVMRSHPIRVDTDRWLMTLYDLGGADTGIHLWVDGHRVRSWVGQGLHEMEMLIWDMQPFRGREVVLEVRDDDPRPDRGIAIDSFLGANLDPR